MWLTRLAISRPIVIWMALAALGILGLLAYSRLPAELNPQVDIPTLTVTTIYPGAGPIEVESLLTKQIEDAVSSVAGLKDVYSSSQESVSIVSMDLAIGTDLERAINSVREKVEAARILLPAEARAPIVARLDLNAQPVLYAALSSPSDPRGLRQKIDALLKPRIARIDGVASVNVIGGEKREIRVDVEGSRLKQYGLTVGDIVNSLKAANQDVPAGTIVQGPREISVRAISALKGWRDVAQAQILSQQLMMGAMNPGMAAAGVSSRPPSPPLTVGDVARVVEAAAVPDTLTRINGHDSVGIVVTRTSNANTADVVEAAKAVIDDSMTSLPSDTEKVYARDDSVLVREALQDVDATLILGALMAMAVVFLFLHNLRGTVIVALALPACLVATFLVMYFAGFSLNQMTLLALSLSTGILIDDSIVVLESITRHLGLGETPEEAAFNGRSEIGFASMTLTLVDVVVFLPIAFMGGIVGAFFRQFGITVVVATLFSLVVSFTVTPSLASRWYRQGDNPEEDAGRLKRLERTYDALQSTYRRALVGALRNRGWVFAFGLCFLAVVLLVAIPNIGVELLPATDQGQIAISIELPPGASLAATDTIARDLEKRVTGTPDVATYAVTVGQIVGGFGSFPQQGAQYAQVNVRLTDKAGLMDRFLPSGRALRRRSDEAVANEIRKRLKAVTGARISVATVRTIAGGGAPVQLQLRGADLAQLDAAASQIRTAIAEVPGVLDPDVSLRTGKPEMRAEVDRHRAAALNLAPAMIGAALRDAVEGNMDIKLTQSGVELPVRVSLAEIDRNEPGDLGEVVVGMSGGKAVTLNEVAALRMGAGPTAIERVNGQRMVTVSANLAPGVPLGTARNLIDPKLKEIAKPGITVSWSGEAETVAENTYYFAVSLGLAVILVYLVMASLFNSLLNPFIIMFTLPMALVGALGAMVLNGVTFSLVAMIGLVMLTGLMGRNAILLIDYIATLRTRGLERDEAIAEAGATRLRPILMTTLATMIGMLPVALRIGRASELRAPMAIVVIGGLLVSTILTLFVIPALYTLFDDVRARVGRRRD